MLQNTERLCVEDLIRGQEKENTFLYCTIWILNKKGGVDI